MAVTRLQRKGKRNKIVAKARLAQIKLLTTKPVVKKVDVDELKNQQTPGAAKAEAKKGEEKA
ncbi:hypothetical protein RCC89_09880 [Cytophagaceae bacterium ABcell3]|nr:hypothetical protein RCC89_09880 [Cytophagaceae bacterium ABcell3]